MSTPEQLPAHPSDPSDEAHDEFDPEPARALPPDEPPSPLWLPIVGAGALLLGAAFWVLTADEPVGEPGGLEGQAPAAGTATAAAPRPADTVRPVARRPRPRPDSTARPRLRRIPPPRPTARPTDGARSK